MRHPTYNAIHKLNKILGIKEGCYDQDWEIEASEPDRIQEYLNLYNKLENSDEKFTLMALILGSFEQYHYLDGYRWEHWPSIKSVMEKDIDIHIDHIKYYQCYDEEDGEDIFPITKRVREIIL